MRLIALLTDFGDDIYHGILMGKILKDNRDAKIITITNKINKFDVRQAAFILERTYKHFPIETIFLFVIDPGVGSGRCPIAAKLGDYYFVGPDNGVLTYIEENEKKCEVVQLDYSKFVSNTFHGRDIFAPATARLSNGAKLKEIGEVTDLTVRIKPSLNQTKPECGDVLFIDGFGNIITNIPFTLPLYKKITVKINRKTFVFQSKRSYFEGEKDNLIILKSSFNTVELSVREGNANALLKLKLGEKVEIL